MEKKELDELLRKTGWTKARLARVLDVTPHCLYQHGKHKSKRGQKVMDFAIKHVLS